MGTRLQAVRHFLSGRRRRPSAARRHYRRLRGEALERRELLATITISGTIAVQGLPCAAGNALVPVRDAQVVGALDANQSIQQEVYTSDSGVYKIVLDTGATQLQQGQPVKVDIKVLANAPVDPRLGKPRYTVINAAGSICSYSFDDAVTLVGQAATDNSHNATLPADNAGKAFAAFSILKTYYQFATANLGAVFTKALTVRMFASANSRYEWGGSATIDLTNFSILNPDLIGHEFGHYVAEQAGFAMAPGFGGTPSYSPPLQDSPVHYLERNARALLPTSSADGSFAAADAVSGFCEGFADYFSVAAKTARDASGLNIPVLAPGNGKFNLQPESDGPAETFNPATGAWAPALAAAPTKNGGFGEDNEASVAQVLWGMSRASGSSDAALYAWLKANQASTLSRIWKRKAATDLANPALGASFQQAGVSPTAIGLDPQGAQTPHSLQFTVPHAMGTQTAAAYTGGCTFQSVQILVFDGAMDNLLDTGTLSLSPRPGQPGYGRWLAIEQPPLAPGTTAPSLTQFAYELTPGDWAEITKPRGAADDGTRYLVVAGIGVPSDSTTTTGPYWSGRVKFTVPLTRPSGKPVTATEGEATPSNTVVATIQGVDDAADAANFTATINWGDGSTPTSNVAATYVAASNGAVISGGHTYAEEGKYAVVVSVDDGGSPFAVVDSTATVGDAALSVTGYTGLTATEGAAFTGAVASFADDAPEDVTQGDYTATINWDDGAGGTPDTSLGTVSAGQDSGTLVVNGYHTYSEAGAFNVTVAVSDMGGSTASAETRGAMTVGYGTLSGSIRDLAADYGSEFQGGPIANFTNAGGADPPSAFTATITWPDYSQSEGTIAATGVPGLYTVSAAANSELLDGCVSVEVADRNTSVTTSDAAYAYTWEGNADNLVAMAVPIVATQGQAFSGTVAAFTDPNPAGTLSATITWPDNSTSPGTVTYDSADQLYAVSGSYTFTQAGSGFTVGVSISETDSYEVASACSLATVNEAIAATGRNEPAGARRARVVPGASRDVGWTSGGTVRRWRGEGDVVRSAA